MSCSLLNSIFRSFAFRPSKQPKFVDGKYLLLESTTLNKFAIFNQYAGALGISFLATRFYKLYSEISWFSTIFQSILGLGMFYMTITSCVSCRIITKRLNLLEDGKRIELTTIGGFGLGKTRIFYIQDIINPETNQLPGILSKEVDSYAMLIHDKSDTLMYVLEPTSTIHDKEILTEVLKGTEIEIEEDVIDI
jgi:hypothetical protein